MDDPYLQLAVYGLLVVTLGAAILLLSSLLGPRRRMASKEEPYECGVPLLGSARGAVHIKFYLVAILFVLFDIETVFLFPWAVNYQALGQAGLVEAGLFMLVLGLGLAYAWRKGVLDWNA